MKASHPISSNTKDNPEEQSKKSQEQHNPTLVQETKTKTITDSPDTAFLDDLKFKQNGKSALTTYAENAKCDGPLVLSQPTEHEALQKMDIISTIQLHLSWKDMLTSRHVSKKWCASFLKARERLLLQVQEQVKADDYYSKLPEFLQNFISIYIKSHLKDAKDRLKTLFSTLALKHQERILKVKDKDYIYNDDHKNIFGDIGIVFIELGYFTFKEMLKIGTVFGLSGKDFCNEYGVLILADELLTKKEIEEFVDKCSKTSMRNNLSYFLCRNGYFALKEKLLSIEAGGYIRCLKSLLSDFGLYALRNKLITSKQAKKYFRSSCVRIPHSYNLETLMSQWGVEALEKKYITPEQAAYTADLESMLSEKVLKRLFGEGLVSLENYKPDQMKAFNTSCLPKLAKGKAYEFLKDGKIDQSILIYGKDSSALLGVNGLDAIEKGLIPFKTVLKIKDPSSFFSDEGYKAFKDGVITVEQALHCENLKILTLPGGVAALKEGLISLEQAACLCNDRKIFSSQSFKVLLNSIGQQALRKGLITPEQAAHFYFSGSCHGAHDNLSDLLTPLGMEALRVKVIKPEDASKCQLNIMFSKQNNPEIILALQRGLVTYKDFQYQGKFYTGNIEQINAEITKLIADDDRKKKIADKGPQAIKIQSLWRDRMNRKKSELLTQLSKQTCSGNVDQSEELDKIKQLIDNGCLNEARQLLAKNSGATIENRCY